MFASEEGAVEVGFMDAAPFFERGVFWIVRLWGLIEPCDRGVVDNYVKMVVFGADVCDDALPLGFDSDVELDGFCSISQIRCVRGALGFVEVGEDDGGALVVELACDGESDALGGSGDECDFVIEAGHGEIPFDWFIVFVSRIVIVGGVVLCSVGA